METAKQFECKLTDSVCDVDWNFQYNMIAMSGFGKEYPILVYVYNKSAQDLAQEQQWGGGIYGNEDDYKDNSSRDYGLARPKNMMMQSHLTQGSHLS